jgi:hypothetical protein
LSGAAAATPIEKNPMAANHFTLLRMFNPL